MTYRFVTVLVVDPKRKSFAEFERYGSWAISLHHHLVVTSPLARLSLFLSTSLSLSVVAASFSFLKRFGRRV